MKRDVILKPNRMFYPEKNYSHQELVLHATLLSRIFFNNNYSRKRSKQKAEGICGEVYPGYRLY